MQESFSRAIAIEQKNNEIKIEALRSKELYQKTLQIKNVMIPSVFNTDFEEDENELLRIYRNDPQPTLKGSFGAFLRKEQRSTSVII